MTERMRRVNEAVRSVVADGVRDLKDPYTVVVLSNTSTMGHAVTEAILSLYKTAPTQP